MLYMIFLNLLLSSSLADLSLGDWWLLGLGRRGETGSQDKREGLRDCVCVCMCWCMGRVRDRKIIMYYTIINALLNYVVECSMYSTLSPPYIYMIIYKKIKCLAWSKSKTVLIFMSVSVPNNTRFWANFTISKAWYFSFNFQWSPKISDTTFLQVHWQCCLFHHCRSYTCYC